MEWIWEIRAKHQDLFAKVDIDNDESVDSDDSNDSDDDQQPSGSVILNVEHHFMDNGKLVKKVGCSVTKTVLFCIG